MSVIKVTENDVENFTVVTTPSRHYVSSSTGGVTGSVKVFPRLSTSEKDTASGFSDLSVNDSDFDTELSLINKKAMSSRYSGSSFFDLISGSYFNLISKYSPRNKVVLDVERLTPTARFTKYTLTKNNIKNVLMKHYKVEYPQANWAYSNYHTL